jgi:hypothetical protein
MQKSVIDRKDGIQKIEHQAKSIPLTEFYNILFW